MTPAEEQILGSGRGLRARAAVWLTVVVLPFLIVGWFTIGLVEDRLETRVSADLANARRLEAARIDDMLDGYEESAVGLAAGPHVIEFVGRVTAARTDRLIDGATIGGYDEFAPIDAFADEPLQQLLLRLRGKAAAGGSRVLDMAIVGPDGTTYGRSPDMFWRPYRPEIVGEVLADGEPRFGNAFRAPDGSHRLGHVVPIRAGTDEGTAVPPGEVVGALVLESRLGPIVDLVAEHEGFGDTSEAHIAQPTPAGDAEFITLLRFERDAAFNKVVARDDGLPINRALTSPEGAVLEAKDYRMVSSVLAVETIEATGWGLVVKIDAAEAYTPVGEVRNAILIASAITAGLVVLISALMMNPLARRIQKLSAAAQAMAEGNYRTRIDDDTGDEVGLLAASIDQLAHDLERDHRLRNEAEDKLRARASLDHLTGVSNRHEAHNRLVDLAAGADRPWSLLFMDLDGFKPINDEHGHGVGDELLRAFAGRLVQSVPPYATVARWGGDEFLVILPGADRENAVATAEMLLLRLDDPFATTAPEPLTISTSIGIATATAGQSNVVDLLRAADAEMMACKANNGGAQRSWNPTERSIAAALADHRVDVHYQPIFRFDENRPILAGAEALVRVRDESGRTLSPGQFLDDVVDGDVGVGLDRFVLRTALADTARLRSDGVLTDDFEMSVNLGAGSLRSPELAERVEEELAIAGLAPDMLVVEISESAPFLDLDGLSRLTALGVKLAVDDLGVDRSNIDRLVDADFTYAKLDQRWLRGARERRVGLARHLVGAVRALGITPVAEGVETGVDADHVRDLDVELAQGYLFARPGPVAEFEELARAASVGNHPTSTPAR